jgi:hypothetical protein
MLYSITFFIKSCRLRDNVEKCSTAGEIIDDNMAYVYYTLGT